MGMGSGCKARFGTGSAVKKGADDISSVSSSEAERAAPPPPKLKKRRKSAVDMLSHSTFAPKRNKWVFNQTFHLYPPRPAFYESTDFKEDEGDEAKGIGPDPNHWTLETTTDPTQVVAEACMRSVETLWTHRQTNLLAKSQNGRDYRKSLGFSILRNPQRDVITYVVWRCFEHKIESLLLSDSQKHSVICNRTQSMITVENEDIFNF